MKYFNHFYHFIVIIFLISVAPTQMHSQNAIWEQTNGPEGGTMRTIAINKNGDLFAGLNGGIFKYTENGWEQTNALWQSTIVQSIVLNKEGQLFAGTWGAGFYRSLDNGETWELGKDPFYSKYITSVEVNEDGDIFVLTSGKGIYRSIDLGDSWTQVNDGLTKINVKAVAFNSQGHVFAATVEGLFKSINKGNNWTPINGDITDLNFKDIAVNPNYDIFAITEKNVFRSTNNGETWNQLNTNLQLDNFCIAINTNGNIYIGEGDGWNYGVLRSTNNGVSWTKHVQGLVSKSAVVEINFDKNGRLYAVTQHNLFYSDTNGASWNSKNKGLKATTAVAMLCSKNNYIILSNKYGILRSIDRGNTWEHTLDRTYQDGIHSFALDPRNGNVIAGQSYYGIYVSTNDGKSWTGMDMGDLRPGINGIAVNSQGHIFVLTSGYGVIRSTDNGINWDQFENELKSSSVIIIDNNDILYVGTHRDGVFISVDNAENWSAVNSGLNNLDIRDLEFDNTGKLFAACYYGDVYWTDDKGENWQQLTEEGDDPANLSDLLILKNGDILAASSYGVHHLEKNGERWNYLNEGLTRDPSVETLAIDSEGYLYAGVWDNSVFRSTYSIVTSTSKVEMNLASTIVIEQNFPNPFVDNTEFTFQLNMAGNINLTIYNILGKKVITLIDDYQQIGRHQISWNGRSQNGHNILPGIYIYTISNNQESISKKFIRSQ